MFEYSVGGASTYGPDTFWQEEGSLSGNPSVKRRGDLYIAAEGPPSDCLMAIKAIRDQYYGDTDQSPSGNTAAFRQSLEAANILLGRRSGIGVSVVAAAVSEWGQLTLLRAGDCHAFVYSGQDGELQRLGERQSADKALGRKAEPQFAETKRMLRDKDILILCSGALVDSLPQEVMTSVAVLYAGEGPEAMATRLVEKASLEDNGGISTVLVVMCKASSIGIEPTLPLVLGQTTRQEPVVETGKKEGRLAGRHQRDLPRPGFGLPSLRDAGRMPLIAGAAVVVVAALLLARPLLSGVSGEDPSAASTVASVSGAGTAAGAGQVGAAQPTLEAPEAMWAKVEDLWRKGEGGSIDAWQEVVLLLERIQLRTPADERIAGRLGNARSNLVYAQHMQDATTYWGTGDTRASTTGSWAKVVSTLEALLAYPLSPPLSVTQSSKARTTLYSARVNYGKALEDAKRKDDARLQYERARELDPKRPEAVDALKRLSR